MLKLPELPYAYDALAPTLSAETLRFHHDKHHGAYVEKTNALAKKAGLDGQQMETIVVRAREAGDRSLFNNAAQAWNHGFFWESMSPKKTAPAGALEAAIQSAFGGLDGLKQKFTEEGAGHFASGWVWLIAGKSGLKVISTHDADDTLTREMEIPLICCDLWEHAYYLDYKNDRPGFLARWFDTLANWDFAARQLAAAREHAGEAYHYPMAA